MLIFQYLPKLPVIPTHLIENLETTVNVHTTSMYTRWELQPDLGEWLTQNISIQMRLAAVQKIDDNMPPHCDKRHWAVNYLIDTGGDEVTTDFYKAPDCELLHPPCSWQDGPMEKIYSIIIEPNRWHIINTRVLHGVNNVKGTRTAVSLWFNSLNPFELLNGYQGFADFGGY